MLKTLQTQHREVARLKFSGFKPAEIATRTEIKLATVRGILADPLCKAYIMRLNDTADEEVVEVRKRMINMNALALDRIEDMLQPYSETPASVVLSAAKDNLDRTGHQVVQQHQHMSVHLNKDDLAEIKKRAVDAGACIDEAEQVVSI